MSNNNQTPNWGNTPTGPQGPWQGQPNPGFGAGPHGQTGPQGPYPGAPHPGAPQQGAPQQGWGPQSDPQQFGPAKKKSKAPIIIAGALALALVVGGVVFALNFLRGSTPAAAEGIPANALAVVEINLNPSVTEKLAVKGFAEKFPALADDVSDIDGDYKKALYLAISDSQADAPDYGELEPWLGDSLAVAALPAAEASDQDWGLDPDMLVAIQVTDRGKAEAFMNEHGDGSEVTFMDDLMLVTDADMPALDVDAIRNTSLAGSDDYKADMDKLGGSWLATGWMGTELFTQFVSESMATTGLTPELPNAHGAMGVKIEGGAAVMRAVSWSDQAVEKGAATSLLQTLPSTSLGAMSFSLSDSVHDLIWEQLEPMVSESPAEAAELGIQSKDDLKAVLGSEIAVSIDMDEYGSPIVGMKVRTPDTAKHEAFLELIGYQLGAQGLDHVTDGDLVTTAFGQSANELADPAETLSDNETVGNLTEGSGDAQAVLWVDVPAILAIPELGLDDSDEMVQNLKPLSGIGMSASFMDGNYTETFIRVGTK